MEDGTGAVPTVVVAADTEADTGLAVGTRYLVAACRRAERMDVRGTSPSDTPDHARDRSSVGWPRRMPFHAANRGSHRRGWSHETRWIRHARGCGFGCGSDGASSLVRLYTGMPIDRNCVHEVSPPGLTTRPPWPKIMKRTPAEEAQYPSPIQILRHRRAALSLPLGCPASTNWMALNMPPSRGPVGVRVGETSQHGHSPL